MANYVVVPHVEGKGWLMIAGHKPTKGNNWITFLKKKPYKGVSAWDLKRTKEGKLVASAITKGKLLYKSPFEAITRLAQELTNKTIEKVGPKLYKMGGITVEILPKNVEDYSWEFQAK